MFCIKCGNEMEDNVAFCNQCGYCIDQTDNESASTNETVNADQTVNVDGTTNASEAVNKGESSTATTEGSSQAYGATPNSTAQPGSAGDSMANKPSGKGAPMKRLYHTIAIVAAVLCVLVLAGFLSRAYISDFFHRTFSSPEEYYRDVETKAMQKITDDMSDYYQYYLDQPWTDQKFDTSVKLQFGEELQDLMGYANLNWLDSVSLGIKGDIKDDQQSYLWSVDLGEKGKLISVNIAADLAERMLYMQVPELNEQYLSFSMDGAFFDGEGMEDFEAWGMMKELQEKLPRSPQVKKLFNKYIALILSYVNNVEKDAEILEAEGVSQKCTTLKITLDNAVIRDMTEAVLTELVADKELETIIKDVAAIDDWADPEEAYADFVAEIEELLVYMDNFQVLEEGQTAVMTLWVDYRGEIRGRSFTVDDEIFAYAMPRKGNKFGYRFAMEAVGLTGSGEYAGDKLSGDFDIDYNAGTILELGIKDYDMKAMNKGLMDGTITLKASDALNTLLAMSAVGSYSSLMPDLTDYTLELTAKAVGNQSNSKFIIYKGEAIFVSLEATSMNDTGGEVTMPDRQAAADGDDEEDRVAWFESVDWDAYIANLEEQFDLPEEIVSYLEWLPLLYGDMGSAGGYYDDEYYDDSYYDDEYYDDGYYDDEYYDDEYYSDEWYFDDELYDDELFTAEPEADAEIIW